MPNTTISFEFPEYKLKAIQQALAEKQEQITIPDMLLKHVEGIYQKHVPAQARTYLDAMLGEPNQATPAQTAQQPPAPEQAQEPPPRRQYNRRNQTTQQQEPDLTVVEGQAAAEQESPEPVQEPGMEMTM